MRRYILVALVLIVIWLGLSVARQASQLVEVQGRIEADKEKLAQLQRQEAELKEEKERRQTEGFIEEEARSKLNKARAGESVVVLPGEKKEDESTQKKEKPVPNWQKWVNLFREG